RLVDVPTGKAIGTKAYTVASQDKDEIHVWAEALACDLINGTTCKGQAIIDADLPEMRAVVDNLQYPRSGKNPETFTVPLGVHNDANALYDAHNGVYLQSDVATIDSARSAATAANVLFVVSAVVIAAGLTMAFAF